MLVNTSPCFEFQVFSTSDLTTPSLRVPCTWASSSTLPTGLIASSSNDKVQDSNATEIRISVHDTMTGFHILYKLTSSVELPKQF
ncbi:hypothetical protein Pelo_19750 [Pelomyxa schiedti]|nr:hypothetical protein Pelo_19750 [Pelomyxa schiedti]